MSDVPLEETLTIFMNGSSNKNCIIYTPNQPPIIKRSPCILAQQTKLLQS